jgi:putative DNA primase/helicase
MCGAALHWSGLRHCSSTIAESGDRKTTVDRLLARAVYEFQDKEREASKASLANHAADVEAWEAKRASAADKMRSDAKGNKSIDGHRADLAQIETSKPVAPRVPRLLFHDVTQEKLMHLLATEWPSGGILASEGGAVLGGHSMGKDSLARTLAALNVLWDGGSLMVDRKMGPSFAVRGARMTVHLMAQGGVLADFLENDRGLSRASGFLARFLVSQPASLQGTRRYREAGDMPHLAGFNARIAELLEEKPVIDPERGMTLPLLDFSPEAKALWVEAYDKIEDQLSTSGDLGAIGDAASKAGENIARIAAVLQIFEHGHIGLISADAVRSATAIVVWHLYVARSLLGPLLLSKDDANAATLDRWLIDRCRMEGVDGFPTGTVLGRGPNCIRKRDVFERAARILADHDRAREIRAGKRRTLKVNPALLVEGGVAAEEEGWN